MVNNQILRIFNYWGLNRKVKYRIFILSKKWLIVISFLFIHFSFFNCSKHNDAMDKETYSAAPFGLLCDLLSNPEQTFISNKLPKFGWIVPSGYQKSYQILVASSKVLLDENKADFWNSKKNNSNQSINIEYRGKAPFKQSTI